jgi:eukaryotic-like serine/threonine-protein kinase
VSCLDEDLVLAFVDGSLDSGRQADIERHLADCAACTDLIAASAGGAPEALAPRSLGDALTNEGVLVRGANVGRYLILRLVGRGGMGEVYAAFDPRLDRKVALKLLREMPGRGTLARAAQERLLREAQAIARLSHPNVVVVHDAGAIDDELHGARVYLAMEFLEGQTLAAWLAAAPRSWREICEVFAAAGKGLLAAHEAGLVHRDFKPQNVMIGRDGAVRVTDFGLAREASDVADAETTALDLARSDKRPTTETIALTRTGVLLGTPLYMAPEQFLTRPTDARTDQFSFCVALYEALYGERPFVADSLQTLVAEVVSGRVRPPSPKTRVPAFLRKILLRGLQPRQEARYASMRELLLALRADPGRRRRRVALGAAAVMTAAVAIGGAERLATRGERMCRGAADKLAGIWELEPRGARRVAVHDSFVRTGSALAEETWTRVSALLDDYARSWTTAYTDTCEATHVRGDQSAEVLDLRMSCLDGSRGGFRALTDVLSHADGRTVIEAVNAAHALPPIERCADVASLRAAVPLPADAAAQARVAELRTRLAEVKALTDTGKWIEARHRVSPLVDAARSAGYKPLLAETLETSSWLETQLGEFARSSTEMLEEDVWVALAAHRDDIAAESAAMLIVATFELSGPSEECDRWEKLATALLRRLGPGHDRIAAWFHQGRSALLLRRGDFWRAGSELELALSLKQRALPPNHPDIAITLASIGFLRTEAGDSESALIAEQRALDIDRAAYGSKSPLLFMILDQRGTTFGSLHRYKEAEDDLRTSLASAEALLGSDHPWTADPSTELGKVLVAEGREREAIPFLENALHLRERADPTSPDLADTCFALARARWTLGQDRPGDRALAIFARDAYGMLPGFKKRAAEIDAWLANTSTRKAKPER